MTTAKSKTKLWPPIHKLTYTSDETAWQVACMVKGRRIREAFPTKEEAETRAAQIHQMVDNEGAAAFSLPADTRAEAAKCVEMLRRYKEVVEIVLCNLQALLTRGHVPQRGSGRLFSRHHASLRGDRRLGDRGQGTHRERK